jgi:uncharacterized protein YgbK (DUF1537 family)
VNRRIIAIADDMTGALEAGAKFSAAGIRALVSATPIDAGSAPAVVFDTETRHLSPERAAEEVKRFILQSGVGHPWLIYKKTDSTLRGHISAELRALAELYPGWRIGYAPAYPGLGRTVKNGVLYVDGVPVAETAFASDPLNPIRTSSVSSILHSELACTIFDGETDAHLEQTARTILSDECMRIAAGPAGLGEMIAKWIDLPRVAAPPLAGVRSCLVMNGSLHPRSATQMQYAEGPGWRALRKDHQPGMSAAQVASENGRYVVEQFAASAPDAVLVIGGDTAFAVIDALGLPPLMPIGEVVPGVPISRIEAGALTGVLPGRNRDLLVITKAGGFAEPDVLRRVRERLNIHIEQP